MHWLIQFLIGEGRLLELWRRADENAVVQLFDPAHRGKLARFVYHWLSFGLPIACFILPFVLGMIDGFGTARGFLAGATGFMAMCGFTGAIALPIFGMIVLRGRMHEREDLEQLCLTPLSRDEIAFGALYWPIKFCYRALTLHFALTWVVAFAWYVSEAFRRSNVDAEDLMEGLAIFLSIGLAASLFFVSAALSTIVVASRLALKMHTSRWTLLYRVPLDAVPHGFWLLGTTFGSLIISLVVGQNVMRGAEDQIQSICAGIAGLLVSSLLVKFQLTHMMRQLCADGPSLYFGSIREPDEPEPLWGKAEWGVIRSKERRRQILDKLRSGANHAMPSEFVSSIGASLGFVSTAIVAVHALVLAFSVDFYRRNEYEETLIERLVWMLIGPGIAFIFPTLVWLAWWILHGRHAEGREDAIRRDAPLLSAVYGVWKHMPAWAVPLVLLGIGFPVSHSHLDLGPETIFSFLSWLLYVLFAMLTACIVAMQVQVSARPMRIVMVWLGIAFAFVVGAGYREPGSVALNWRLDDDVVFTVLAGVFVFGSAVLYILPVAAHAARHRGLTVIRDDEEEEKEDTLTSSSSSSGLGITE